MNCVKKKKFKARSGRRIDNFKENYKRKCICKRIDDFRSLFRKARSVERFFEDIPVYDKYEELLQKSDAIYLITSPIHHYEDIKTALEMKKHVLCESPIALSEKQCQKLFELARENTCILMDAIKTAYSTAYHRMLLLVKTGVIGEPKCIDATCTSIKKFDETEAKYAWNSISAWGPTALLPVFQIFGIEYKKKYFNMY